MKKKRLEIDSGFSSEAAKIAQQVLNSCRTHAAAYVLVEVVRQMVETSHYFSLREAEDEARGRE